MAKANLSITYFDNDDLGLQAQTRPVPSPQNGFALSITSRRQESRHPQSAQVRFFACLETEALKALVNLIQTELQASSKGATA